MLGVMKLTSNEVEKHPWDVLEKIKKVIWGKEKDKFDGVRIELLRAPGAYWHTTFGGVSIETYNENSKTVRRRSKENFY